MAREREGASAPSKRPNWGRWVTTRHFSARSDRGEGEVGTARTHGAESGNVNAHQQREPERGNERPGHGQRAGDTRRVSAETRTPTCVRAMWSASRLADGFQTSSDGNRFPRGSGLQQPGVLTPPPPIRTRAAPAAAHRWSRERRTHTHAHAGGHGRQRMAYYVLPGGDTSDKACPQTYRMRRCGTVNINIHHWHTNNVLWLMGRLPWHRVTYNA